MQKMVNQEQFDVYVVFTNVPVRQGMKLILTDWFPINDGVMPQL